MIGVAVKRLKYELHYLRRRTFRSRFKKMAPDPFATHIPILLGVAAITSPLRILELGGGRFSTPCLADRSLFPSVKEVHTLEDDPEWANVLHALDLEPGRSCVEVVPSIRHRLVTMDISPYDLIFVDNSMSVAERADTLAVVLDRARSDAIVVVHDFEWRAYRAAVKYPWKYYSFRVWKPETGVLWRNERLSRQQLTALGRILCRGSAAGIVSPDHWFGQIGGLH